MTARLGLRSARCVLRCQPRQVLIFAAVEDQRPQVVVSVQVVDGQYDDVMITGLDLLGDAGFDPAAGAFEQDGAVLGDPPVQRVESPFAACPQLPADVEGLADGAGRASAWPWRSPGREFS